MSKTTHTPGRWIIYPGREPDYGTVILTHGPIGLQIAQVRTGGTPVEEAAANAHLIAAAPELLALAEDLETLCYAVTNPDAEPDPLWTERVLVRVQAVLAKARGSEVTS